MPTAGFEYWLLLAVAPGVVPILFLTCEMGEQGGRGHTRTSCCIYVDSAARLPPGEIALSTWCLSHLVP